MIFSFKSVVLKKLNKIATQSLSKLMNTNLRQPNPATLLQRIALFMCCKQRIICIPEKDADFALFSRKRISS